MALAPSFHYAVEDDGDVYVWDDMDGEEGGASVPRALFDGFRHVADTLGYEVTETARTEEEECEDCGFPPEDCVCNEDEDEDE